MVIDYRDRVLQMAEARPLLPSNVAKEFGVNTLMASAMLSEMASKGILKISALKIGSSPLYYKPDKKEQLLNYLDSLNEKDRKTTELLKEKTVLRDSAQDSLTRVSLRNIKDFAKPVEVSTEKGKELFWKWYLASDDETEQAIRQILYPKQQEQKQEKQTPQKTKRKRATKKSPSADEFLKKVRDFFSNNKIEIIEQIAIKKKTEYDFIIKLHSTVGALTYYCKAKNKKSAGESDVSHAFVQGQMRNLPVLFLTTGDLTKQALALSQELKGLKVKKI